MVLRRDNPGVPRTLFWITLLFILLTISCSFTSNLGEQVSGVRETAGSVATSIQEGRDLLSTGQAAVTQLANSELVQTAMALATEQGPSFLATVQALATEQGPSLRQTVEAFATDEGPSIRATVEAFATEQGPGLARTGEALITQGPSLVETGQAVATQVAGSSGEVPTDIPLVEDDRADLVVSGALISYTTSMTYEQVLDFYETRMPASGWTKSTSGSLTGTESAVLVFQKSSRQATVAITAIPTSERTAVLINIQGEE